MMHLSSLGKYQEHQNNYDWSGNILGKKPYQMFCLAHVVQK